MLNFSKKTNILVYSIILLALVSSIALLSFYTFKQKTQVDSNIEFSLVDIQGNLIHLRDIKAKKIIINYWASWCAPCREEIPALNGAWHQLEKEGIAMIAINYGENKQTVIDFLKAFPIEFTTLLDEENIASEEMSITAMPTTLIINQQGNILERILGPREWDSLDMINHIKSL